MNMSVGSSKITNYKKYLLGFNRAPSPIITQGHHVLETDMVDTYMQEYLHSYFPN